MPLLRILVYAVLGYAVLCAFVYLMQRSLLYHPAPAAPVHIHLRALGLTMWPSEGNSFRGYANSNGEQSGQGVVVVFHGNAGAAWAREHYARALGELGYRVVLAEYPGYGGRWGELTEGSLVADARETVRLAHEEFGGPVYVCGESLGAAVAAAVAGAPPGSIAGVIAITPWDTLPSLAQTIYWYLPARWMVRDRYDNMENLAKFGGRVAIVVAEHDEIIPMRHAMRLYESLPNVKKLWTIEGTMHNTWPYQVGAEWWQEIMSFVAGIETASD